MIAHDAVIIPMLINGARIAVQKWSLNMAGVRGANTTAIIMLCSRMVMDCSTVSSI